MRIAALIVLALAPAGGDVVGLRELEQAFKFTRRPESRFAVRDAALAGLRGDSGKVAKALLEATATLEDEALEIERDRRGYLSTGAADHELQARSVLDPLRAYQERIRARLLALEDRGAAVTTFEVALESPKVPFTLRMELASYASEIDDHSFARVVKSLKSRHPDEVSVALRAVARRAERPAELVEPVVARLEHRSPVVRELAAETLAVLARPECVEPLILGIAREAGRTRQRFGRALEVLTRTNLPPHPAAWSAWWQDHAAAVRAGELELGGGTPAARDTDHGRYHDIPIDGDAVLYAIDRSGSMKKRLEGTITLPDGRQTRDRRIFRAMNELVRSLESLPAGKRFNIVAFGEGALAFADEMQDVEPKTVEAARNWVYALELEVGTSMYDGLDLAFALGGRPERDGFHEVAFDTLFVLTDGVPSVSTAPGLEGIVLDSTDAILAATRRWNLLGRVVIHTIGLGDEVADAFLATLAAENGGHSVREE
jgi:Mg-chelatase subunit ChlD